MHPNVCWLSAYMSKLSYPRTAYHSHKSEESSLPSRLTTRESRSITALAVTIQSQTFLSLTGSPLEPWFFYSQSKSFVNKTRVPSSIDENRNSKNRAQLKTGILTLPIVLPFPTHTSYASRSRASPYQSWHLWSPVATYLSCVFLMILL